MTHIQTIIDDNNSKYYLIDDIKIFHREWDYYKKTSLFTTKQKRDFDNYLKANKNE